MAASHEETIREALDVSTYQVGEDWFCAGCRRHVSQHSAACPIKKALAALDALVADRRTLAEKVRERCAEEAGRRVLTASEGTAISAAIRALDVSALLADERRR